MSAAQSQEATAPGGDTGIGFVMRYDESLLLQGRAE